MKAYKILSLILSIEHFETLKCFVMPKLMYLQPFEGQIFDFFDVKVSDVIWKNWFIGSMDGNENWKYLYSFLYCYTKDLFRPWIFYETQYWCTYYHVMSTFFIFHVKISDVSWNICVCSQGMVIKVKYLYCFLYYYS